MRQNIRYAFRTLRKSPGFTIVALMTLTLAIGANATIFSAVKAVLLRPLSYRQPDRLVAVWESNPKRGFDIFPVLPEVYQRWKTQAHSFEQIGFARDKGFTLTGDGEPESIRGYMFSANFFNVFGTQPELGRTFSAEDATPGHEQVAVLSHSLWQRRYAGDRSVVGRSITLDGKPYTVIGVMPSAFRHPLSVVLWVPLTEASVQNSKNNILRLVGRLKPGATAEQADAELNSIMRQMEGADPKRFAGWNAKVRPLRDEYYGDIRTPLLALLAAVGFVLLIGCGNVANLLLARAASR